MPDVILAVLGRKETAPHVLEAARQLVTLMSHAKLIVLAVEMPPLAEPLGAEALIAEVAEVAELHERDRQRTAALRVLFDEWAVATRQAGIETEWRKITGPAGEIAEQMGRRADFIVIARPMADDDAHTRGGFHAALLRSERPVLVVPPGGDRHVWTQRRHCMARRRACDQGRHCGIAPPIRCQGGSCVARHPRQ